MKIASDKSPKRTLVGTIRWRFQKIPKRLKSRIYSILTLEELWNSLNCDVLHEHFSVLEWLKGVEPNDAFLVECYRTKIVIDEPVWGTIWNINCVPRGAPRIKDIDEIMLEIMVNFMSMSLQRCDYFLLTFLHHLFSLLEQVIRIYVRKHY